jgi:glycosyltransferase involved in cell wall biosynthesis
MKYAQYLLKRKLENFLIAPFIGIGKLIHLLKGHKKNYDIYFFFPFYHLGGAEKIHLQIAQLTNGKKALVVFTRISNNHGFLEAFKEIGLDIEIASPYTNNDLLRLPINLIARGYYAARVNKDNAIVFNGQSNFGYKVSPWIKKEINQIELLHSFNSFSWIRIPFISYYSTSVMISKNKIEEHFRQYDNLQIPKYLKDRIVYIPNAVDPISNQVGKTWAPPFKILYVGRGSAEKRIQSILSIAIKSKENKLPFEFELIGDVAIYLTQDAHHYVTASGMINDKEALNSKYQLAHFIILLSSTEGMPLVVLEAMQNGCIPIVTKVGDLPNVINDNNGFCINNAEETIIQDTYETLMAIAGKPQEQLIELSEHAKSMVAHNYSMQQFTSNYQQLLGLK